MDKEQLQDYIKYLRSHPEAYIEMVTGRKLPLWKKIFVRMMDKIENRKYKGKIVFKCGSMIVAVPTKGVVRGNKSKYIYPNDKDCFCGINGWDNGLVHIKLEGDVE